MTITMPHPERSFRYVQNSWRPAGCGGVQRLDAPVPQCAPIRGLSAISLRMQRAGQQVEQQMLAR